MLRGHAPKMNLYSTAQHFVDQLCVEDLAALRRQWKQLDGCTIRVATTCSGCLKLLHHMEETGGRTRRSREEPTHMYIGASPYTAASTYTQRSPEEPGEAGKSQGEAGGAKENQEPIRRSEDPNACRSGPLTDPQKRFPSPQAQDDSRVWLLKRTPTCVPAYIHMYTHM